MKKLSISLYTAGFILVAGAAGATDTNPGAPFTEFILTAGAGMLAVLAGYMTGHKREKAKKVHAGVEVLQPVGGQYCHNPYHAQRGL